MSAGLTTLIASFVVLALARVPIALAMLVSGFAYLFVTGQDLGIVADQVMNSLYGSYVLLAVPMFILAANIMTIGSISERLWRAADALVGGLPGGLGHVTVLVSLVFSSMSGSALADAAGPNLIALRMMRDVGGFRPGFAAALTAAAATIAPIIPPSIPLVLYALNSGASVGALFLGGIIPGLVVGVLLMAGLALMARRQGLAPRPAGPRGTRRTALASAAVPMTIPVVLLGGIWTGVFTPTEAAAVAALYALFIGTAVYRAIGLAALGHAIAESMRVSSTIMLLIAGAFMMNYAITVEQLDRALAAWISGAGLSQTGFLIAINIAFLALGCMIDTGTLILVFVPMLLPTVHALGIDPVHFGVLITVNIMIGLVTPPFGMLLFTLAKLGEVPLSEVIGEIWPFIGILVTALALITFVPASVLWLPGVLGF
ncbi:TRAP transporter large permease (plasmid) [Paroceanicella profunda]|uniref:TRAP transporter large permease protein n=1 Tax=Paroceanicella profunda TaxID=2579971 RepID=A0A5B8FIN6_9RHOB|nr:TRAP transporter large permease [Paroceanicella profunda]QDL94021.1 TRAP transporter large permease [Paroceanicella profunda]